MKHFNAGNVWGRIIDIKRGSSRKGTPFAWIRIDCSGDHGSFYVYGRMWGAQRVEGLLSHFKKAPTDTIRFRGFFEQYTKKVDYWNFTFYSWEPAPGKPHKAAFVLRGAVTGVSTTIEGDVTAGKISLWLSRPGKEGYPDIEENIDVFLADHEKVNIIGEGETWEMKGYISQGGGEDEFGLAGGLIRPYVVKYTQVDKNSESGADAG